MRAAVAETDQGLLEAALASWTAAAVPRQQAAERRRQEEGLASLLAGNRLIPIPPGVFRMGSNNGDNDEKPIRSVRIAKGFKMLATEVAWQQYMQCVNAEECRFPDDEGWGRGRRPVINVSWEDAQTYINWLNRESGLKFRLPSEAEWEYAARAGSTGSYSIAGGTKLAALRRTVMAVVADGTIPRPRRWPVLPPMPSGSTICMGMYGNVWEWVTDCQHGDYTGASEDGRIWEESNCQYLRSAYRNNNSPSARSNNNGIRLVQDDVF